MKRFATLLLILVLCLSLGMTALADVVYEPEDDFYEKHRDECYYENRVYIASGEAGFAAVKKSPTSNKTLKELPNGEEVYVSYIWGQEGGWGLMDGTGWISMKELTVKYDSISFEQEHGREFLLLEEPELLDLSGCEGFGLWEYPGDKAPYARLSWTGDDAWFSGPPDDLTFNTIYEGPDGLRWGYMHYYYGHRDFWVCLSEPDAKGTAAEPTAPPVEKGSTETPAPTEAPVSTASPAPASPEPTELPPLIDPEPPRPIPWAPAALALGAMAVAGGLLAAFRRKK